eukprot:CAMPEP_0172721166 /NCGR_PEP_ID=MMETSP1074-20121228/78469_1 /TAXON_ID=2916 /ORGANISM="Ceratium fusus, Strain PA161109" /LENGTH=184 /DNA_ID=CAMNT_0013546845 /DNA_START=129 /DNA_END=683 /DNA_ORIENTATION=-
MVHRATLSNEAALRAASQLANSPDQALGTLKGLFDGYISKYSEEQANWQEAKAEMDNLVNVTKDAQAKESAINEKFKMQDEHEGKLQSIAGFIRTLDSAIQAMHAAGDGKTWLDKYPDTKKKVDEIYSAHPALLAQSSRLVAAGGKLAVGGMSGAAQTTWMSRLVQEARVYLNYLGGGLKATHS